MTLFEFEKIIKEKFNNSNKELDYWNYYLFATELIKKIFPFYFSKINVKYIENLLSNKNNKLIVFCIDNKFIVKNITSILIYHKTIHKKISKYYILALGSHERVRKYGYGKILLDEFIEWIKLNDNSSNSKQILLKSLESSMGFYLDYGFCCAELKSNKLFYKYESVQELTSNKEKILCYNIKN